MNHTLMNNLTRFILSLLFICLVTAGSTNEYGTYVNPNPRPINKCDANDLIKLSGCCNDVLKKLDECKADDLACECCALQSIQQECYHLCPGNPSTNFLTVLLNDCVELSEINACNLPFKKDDNSIPKVMKKKNKNNNDIENENLAVTSIKSRVNSKPEIDDVHSGTSNLHSVESPFRNKKIKLVLNEEEEGEESTESELQANNVTNKTVNVSGAIEYTSGSARYSQDTWVFIVLFICFLLVLN